MPPTQLERPTVEVTRENARQAAEKRQQERDALQQYRQQQARETQQAARETAQQLNPDLVKLDYIKQLNAPDATDALTWLTDDEITDFSILYAVDAQLRTPSGRGGIPAAITLLDRFKSQRRSKEGLVLQSIVSILRQASHYMPMAGPGMQLNSSSSGGDGQPQQSFISKLLGGRRR